MNRDKYWNLQENAKRRAIAEQNDRDKRRAEIANLNRIYDEICKVPRCELTYYGEPAPYFTRRN